MKQRKLQHISAPNLRAMNVGGSLYGNLSQLTALKQTIQRLQDENGCRWSTRKESDMCIITRTL